MISIDGEAVITNHAFLSSDFSLIIFDIYKIISQLAVDKFELPETTFILQIKTSLIPKTVDGINFSELKWQNCVHFTQLKMKFDL